MEELGSYCLPHLASAVKAVYMEQSSSSGDPPRVFSDVFTCSFCWTHDKFFQIPGQVRGPSSTTLNTPNSRFHSHQTLRLGRNTPEKCCLVSLEHGKNVLEEGVGAVTAPLTRWNLNGFESTCIRIDETRCISSNFRRLEHSGQGVRELEGSLLGLYISSSLGPCQVPLVYGSMF